MSEEPEEKEGGHKESGEAILDMIIRGWLLLPFAISLGDFWAGIAIVALGIFLWLVAKQSFGLILAIAGGAFLLIGNFLIKGLPVTIYSLAKTISIDLLPLSAFPKLEGAATWLLWIFIGLMFAGAGWRNMLMMLAIGGVAMGFISSLGVFAVADSEITASYNDLVQNTKVKNDTASGVSNIWLMISNPRLWYEQQYGYKNDTLAQGLQTSPFALEITKAEILEKVAPPNGKVTLDLQVRNKGQRNAVLKRIDVAVENENLGKYDRWTKAVATIEENRDNGYLYFESTPDTQAHYEFCDNPVFEGDPATHPDTGKNTYKVPESFYTIDGQPFGSATKGYSSAVTKLSGATFEPGTIDEYFVELKSPECYGRQKVNATVAYTYNVTSTYNLEVISSEYFTELAKYNKLKFHTENSRSSEGPLKLTIRSVPEEQPVRMRGENGENKITVFYSLSNTGAGTAVIRGNKDIYLEDVDSDLTILPECDFVDIKYKVTGDKSESPIYILKNDSANSFFTSASDASDTCTLSAPEVGVFKDALNSKCLTLPADDPNKLVLLKCSFNYKGTFDKTKTLYMKMHVTYDYLASKKAQYETIPLPGSHPCITKRSLDGFPNRTMMDEYLKEVFKDEVDAAHLNNLVAGACWGEEGIKENGAGGQRPCFCPDVKRCSNPPACEATGEKPSTTQPSTTDAPCAIPGMSGTVTHGSCKQFGGKTWYCANGAPNDCGAGTDSSGKGYDETICGVNSGCKQLSCSDCGLIGYGYLCSSETCTKISNNLQSLGKGSCQLDGLNSCTPSPI